MSRAFVVNVKDGTPSPMALAAFEVVGKRSRLLVSRSTTPPGAPSPDHRCARHQSTPVPADASHIHFGKGQSKHVLNVAPGQHTLTLQFADGAHRSYGPEWATSITVTVTAAKE